MSEVTENKVQTISDEELDSLLGTPGADDIMTAADAEPKEQKEEKKTVLSSMTPDMSFLEKLDEKESDVPKEQKEEQKIETKEQAKEIIDEIVNKEPEPVETKSSGGDSLRNAIKKQIEKGNLFLYEDNNDIDTYSEEDIENLLEENRNLVREKTEEEFKDSFMMSLPFELQQACLYHFNGGNDLKSMFKVLSTTEEYKSFNTEKKEDQKAIIREYLRKKEFGTEEEIQDEIEDLEDRGKLKDRAEKYKPMLDEAQKKEIEKKNKKEEENMKKRQAAAGQYIDSVYNLVNEGEINGLKLNNKTQDMIYSGLVENNMTSPSGRKCNKFGYLLEKYQWQEPRHDLIAECFWLLADPEGYKKSVIDSVKKEITENTVRKLKTEQQSSKGATTLPQEERSSLQEARRSTLQRPQKGFFSWKN